MILLNLQTGELKFDDTILSPGYRFEDVKNLSKKYRNSVREIGNGYNWIYLLGVDGDYDLSVLFHKDVLISINIGLGASFQIPEFEITKRAKNLIKKLVKELGGEKEYDWGIVRYSEDHKGGYVSVLIKYN